MKLRLLNMREELVEFIKSLSDEDYQRNCWVNKKCPAGVEYDDFNNTIHFLFDDTCLANDPESLIGEILLDFEESAAIKRVCDNLEIIFIKYGFDKSDEEYIALPEWDNVVTNSAVAYQLLIKNG